MFGSFSKILIPAISEEVIEAESEEVIPVNPKEGFLANSEEGIPAIAVMQEVDETIEPSVDEDEFATICMDGRKLFLHYTSTDFLFYGILEVSTTHFIYLAVKQIEKSQSLISGNIYYIG